jgi:hypothetical protein
MHVQASETLVAHVSNCNEIINGSSLGVAAALSLLSLVLEVGRVASTCWAILLAFLSGIAAVITLLRMPVQLPADRDGENEDERETVVVTGGMDLLGRVQGVDGLTAKIQVKDEQILSSVTLTSFPSCSWPCCWCLLLRVDAINGK